jgi:hypothetical protein
MWAHIGALGAAPPVLLHRSPAGGQVGWLACWWFCRLKPALEAALLEPRTLSAKTASAQPSIQSASHQTTKAVVAPVLVLLRRRRRQ